MCGVIKRPQLCLTNIPMQYFGIANLDHFGNCTIILPYDFPDEEKILQETLRSKSFGLIYTLTAIGAPMPNLHVSREVCRVDGILLNKESKNKRKKKISNNEDKIRINNNDQALHVSATIDHNNSAPNLTTLENICKSPVIKSSNSVNDLQSITTTATEIENLHNDRLIDGPLPLQNSLKQLREGFISLRSLSSNTQVSEICNALDSEERYASSNTQTIVNLHEQNKTILDEQHNVINDNNIVPLSFSISGGSSLGKVSWILQTVPVSTNQNQYRNTGISVPVGTSASGNVSPSTDLFKLSNDIVTITNTEIKNNKLQGDWREIS